MSHTATGEWKSFEIRMRRRRAERCVARADIDLARGALGEARTALQEARRLAPDLPSLDDLEQSIQAAETSTRARGWFPYGVAAVILLTASVGTIWMARTPSSFQILWSAPSARSQSSPVPAAWSPPDQPHPPATPVAELPGPRVVVDEEPITVAENPAPPVAPGTVEADATTGHTVEPPQLRSSFPPDGRNLGEVGSNALPNVATLPVETVGNPSQPTLSRLDAVPILSLPARNPVVANADSGPAAPAPMHTPPLAASVAEPAVATVTPGPSPAAPREDALVQQTLDRYATAYTRLDAEAAQQVWPSVDRGALARAFGGLALQRVALGDCRIDVQGPVAKAACAGTETWAPKIGARAPQTAARNWTFELVKAGSEWRIVSARVQNK